MTEKHSILVVEDDRLMIRFYELMLGREFTVLSADNVVSARAVLETAKVDRLICDGLEGEFVTMVRAALEFGLPHSAIIVISGTEKYRAIAENELKVGFGLKGQVSYQKMTGKSE